MTPIMKLALNVASFIFLAAIGAIALMLIVGAFGGIMHSLTN